MRVGRWQLVPLRVELLKTYAGASTGENAEILAHVRAVHRAAGGQGTWLLDRGFDRRNLFGPLVQQGVAFVAWLVGDRQVRAAEGRTLAVKVLAYELRPGRWPTPRPRRGYTAYCEVRLPEVCPDAFLLVVHWRWPDSARP